MDGLFSTLDGVPNWVDGSSFVFGILMYRVHCWR